MLEYRVYAMTSLSLSVYKLDNVDVCRTKCALKKLTKDKIKR